MVWGELAAPERRPVATAKCNWFKCFWEIFLSVLRRSLDDYWLVNWLIGNWTTVSQQHHHSSYRHRWPTLQLRPHAHLFCYTVPKYELQTKTIFISERLPKTYLLYLTAILLLSFWRSFLRSKVWQNVFLKSLTIILFCSVHLFQANASSSCTIS